MDHKPLILTDHNHPYPIMNALDKIIRASLIVSVVSFLMAGLSWAYIKYSNRIDALKRSHITQVDTTPEINRSRLILPPRD